MRVTYHPHHILTARYGTPYVCAVREAGHDVVLSDDGDVLLSDCDDPYPPWSDWCATAKRTLIYPHGASSIVWTNNPWIPRHTSTTHRFVTGTGHVDVGDAVGDVPATVHGWPWTPLLPFRRCELVRTIMFAPNHATNEGWCHPLNLKSWQEAVSLLPGLIPPETRWLNSLTPHTMDETVTTLMQSDLCITSSQTVLALAVALGVPAVMFGWHKGQIIGYDCDAGVQRAPSAAHMAALLDVARYPYGLNDIPAALTCEASEWRRRFVGGPWDPAGFVQAFEQAAQA